MPALSGEHCILVSRGPAVIVLVEGPVHLSGALLNNLNSELVVRLGADWLVPCLGGSLPRQMRGLPRLTGQVARLEEQPYRCSSLLFFSDRMQNSNTACSIARSSSSLSSSHTVSLISSST
jgi:hypothetical protein